MGNRNANTSQVFIHFLDDLLKDRQTLFETHYEKTVYVMDNTSMHKTKRVDEYSKEKSLLIIPAYTPALNGAEAVIQAIK